MIWATPGSRPMFQPMVSVQVAGRMVDQPTVLGDCIYYLLASNR